MHVPAGPLPELEARVAEARKAFEQARRDLAEAEAALDAAVREICEAAEAEPLVAPETALLALALGAPMLRAERMLDAARPARVDETARQAEVRLLSWACDEVAAGRRGRA